MEMRIPSTRERAQMAWAMIAEAEEDDCMKVAMRTGISYKRAAFMLAARRRMRRDGEAVPAVWREALRTPAVMKMAGRA